MISISLLADYIPMVVTNSYHKSCLLIYIHFFEYLVSLFLKGQIDDMTSLLLDEIGVKATATKVSVKQAISVLTDACDAIEVHQYVFISYSFNL